MLPAVLARVVLDVLPDESAPCLEAAEVNQRETLIFQEGATVGHATLDGRDITDRYLRCVRRIGRSRREGAYFMSQVKQGFSKRVKSLAHAAVELDLRGERAE